MHPYEFQARCDHLRAAFQQLVSENVRNILVPVNVGGNHFVALAFRTRDSEGLIEVLYNDSIRNPITELLRVRFRFQKLLVNINININNRTKGVS